MSDPREFGLTREEVITVARQMRAARPTIWTVIVEGRQLPARRLVLGVKGALPNDPTNSHQAVKMLQDLGFEIRYRGRPVK